MGARNKKVKQGCRIEKKDIRSADIAELSNLSTINLGLNSFLYFKKQRFRKYYYGRTEGLRINHITLFLTYS